MKILVPACFLVSLLSEPWSFHGKNAIRGGVEAFTLGFTGGIPSTSLGRSTQSGMTLPMTTKSHFNIHRQNNKSRLFMVFDKMSDNCIQAVKASQEFGTQLGLDVLRTELLLVGVISEPERAFRTLKKYDLDSVDQVKEAVIRTLTYKSDVAMKRSAATTTTPSSAQTLPFSDESRAVLTKALTIAERMESPTIRSEHVLLALMGYNGGKPIKEVPILEVLGDIPSLKQSKENFSVTKFCEDLVNALPMTPYDDDPDLVIRDRVVIGGRSGNTNTLSEVGVDLTQLALEGKLDLVYGRDQEIRSALRTLGRRRKNNPCLIGDPGTIR